MPTELGIAADSAAGAVAQTVRLAAHANGMAFVAVDARIEPAAVERLGRFLVVVHYFAFDGGVGDSELPLYLLERLALPDGGLQRKAQVVRQMFVLFFLDCHVGLPFAVMERQDCRTGI